MNALIPTGAGATTEARRAAQRPERVRAVRHEVEASPARANQNRLNEMIAVAVAGGRAAATAGRIALLPARLALRAPLLGPRLRRRGDGLSRDGQHVRTLAILRAEEFTAGVLASPEVRRVAARVLPTAELDRLIGALLEHERTEQVAERVLASPGLERLAVRALESRLFDELTERFLHSPEMERIVEYLATSPQVLDAVSYQTRSLADELAWDVRRRARSVDDGAERTVRGWRRRASSMVP